MKVSLPIKNQGRETCYRIHTYKIHALDDDCLTVCTSKACERGGPVTALLLDNESSSNKLFQLNFPRDSHCQMWQTWRWRQATAIALGVGSMRERSEEQVSYPACETWQSSISEDTGDNSIWLIHKPSTADWSTTRTTDETLALMTPREFCQ